MKSDIQVISAAELGRRLREVLNDVEHGQAFRVYRYGKAIATLAPVPVPDAIPGGES